MNTQETIDQLPFNFKKKADITMTDAIFALGIGSFELTGNPMTQEEWDAQFVNNDSEQITFAQALAKFAELVR